MAEITKLAHKPGAGPLTIHLHANEAYLRIGVWDALRQPPAQHPHDPAADHGRGLQIVAATSHDWGTYHPPAAARSSTP